MNICVLMATFISLQTASASADTISECQELLRVGKYVECLDATTAAVDGRKYGEDWPVLKAEAEMQLGRYLEAAATIEAGVLRYTWSIRLRMQALSLSRIIGDPEKAQRMLDEINRLATGAPWRYTDADDLVALGSAAIEVGADPKDVLEGFFERARRNYKSRPDGHLAVGKLALDKGDMALAADVLRPAAEQFPDNPAALFLLAEAIHSSSPEEAAELTKKALEINPAFLPALQSLAARQIDAEAYPEAEDILARIHQTNPWHPESHALQAVIHHLQNRPLEEARSRSRAMAFSGADPVIDHLIGEKLSRKYRFSEGAEYQKQALKADPFYLPAKVQLAQDLLRLGRDVEGWQLADEAQKQDKYSTTLFNLMSLKDSIDNFATIQNERFIIRMEKTEAAVYGAQVESLLNRAFDHLSEKYHYVPTEPIVVEIFNRQDDFAVRTFGIPDVAGFLGVCFGKLITANSPASQRENPNNWESVLWHEFCHVITLQMTENKIPRWLSEGISVYEERQQDTRWGQHMTPTFRERVKSGSITPVSELSSAFLNAKSGQDLNFAYYESSMVAEFIVQEHGFESLLGILSELRNGFTINDALERHTNGLADLDAAFETYLRSVADEFAKDVEFTIEEDAADRVLEIAVDNPQHYTAGLAAAAGLIRDNDLAAAESRLQQLIQLYPEDDSANGARRLLAVVHERLEQPEEQAEVLAAHLERSGDDLDAAMTLLSLQVQAEQWNGAVKTGQMVMAIDPLQPKALRNILQAVMATSNDALAVQILSGLLELEPSDAARFHFQIAKIVQSQDPAASRRHILLSLEQAPRYRDAHRLLLELSESPKTDTE